METRLLEVELEDFTEITNTENTLAGEILKGVSFDNLLSGKVKVLKTRSLNRNMKKRMGKSIFLKKVTVSVLAMAVLVSSVTGCGKKESNADVKSVNQIKEIDKDHFFKETNY